jgi:hypothetical protein
MVQPGVEIVDDTGAPARTLVDLSKRWVYAPRTSTPHRAAGRGPGHQPPARQLAVLPVDLLAAGPLRRTGFREGLSVVQDLALVIDLVLDGESLLVEPVTCFRYRRHRSSVSSAHAADGRRFAEERGFFLDAPSGSRPTAGRAPPAPPATTPRRGSTRSCRCPWPCGTGSGTGVRTLARHAFGGGGR